MLCTVTGLPFDQMEPSRSMQHRSGNPVRILKSVWDFPVSELSLKTSKGSIDRQRRWLSSSRRYRFIPYKIFFGSRFYF